MQNREGEIQLPGHMHLAWRKQPWVSPASLQGWKRWHRTQGRPAPCRVIAEPSSGHGKYLRNWMLTKELYLHINSNLQLPVVAITRGKQNKTPPPTPPQHLFSDNFLSKFCFICKPGKLGFTLKLRSRHFWHLAAALLLIISGHSQMCCCSHPFWDLYTLPSKTQVFAV